MSKLRCTCGGIIVDQTDNLPYKAAFIKDQDLDQYLNYLDDIQAFLNALKSGRRNEWIKEFFSATYPKDLADSSIIFDILLRYNVEFENTIYQCENCGRLHMQVHGKNLFASFKPEDENFKDLLKHSNQESTD